MPVLLLDRSALVSPVPLVTAAEGRMLGLALGSRTHRRIRPGVYCDRAEWAVLREWEKYHVRVHAFLRAHPDAVLCLESAAVVQGLPSFGNTRDIHVYDPDRAASRRFGDVCVHTGASPRSIETVAGISLTSLLDTTVDLARVLPAAHALAVADTAVSSAQGGGLTVAVLRDHAAVQPSTRGRARLRWLWENVDGRSESPGESFSRAVIVWSGFETPQLQPEFSYEGFVDRADFFFASTNGIGESDGWGKYNLADPESAARHLTREKRREDRLRRHGHPVARWTFADAARVTPLCRALHAAGVPVVRPAQTAMLHSIRSSPRLLPAEPRTAAEKPPPA